MDSDPPTPDNTVDPRNPQGVAVAFMGLFASEILGGLVSAYLTTVRQNPDAHHSLADVESAHAKLRAEWEGSYRNMVERWEDWSREERDDALIVLYAKAQRIAIASALRLPLLSDLIARTRFPEQSAAVEREYIRRQGGGSA